MCRFAARVHLRAGDFTVSAAAFRLCRELHEPLHELLTSRRMPSSP